MFTWQLLACADREEHDLSPGEFGFEDWAVEFEESPAYQSGDVVLGVDAVVGFIGSSAIVLVVGNDGERRVYSPYFNEMADEPYEYDESLYESEIDEINDNATEWLGSMAGATEWRNWNWEEIE